MIREGKSVSAPANPKRIAESEDCECQGLMRILVIDRLGGWMKQWDNAFRALELEHLRSPLFFHPAPADLDALLAFAEKHGCSSSPDADHDALGGGNRSPRQGRRRQRRMQDGEPGNVVDHRHSAAPPGYSLREIANCVGKEISKHRIKSRQKRQGKMSIEDEPAPSGEAERKAQGVDATAGYARMLRDIGPAVNERDRKDYHVPSTKLFRE